MHYKKYGSPWKYDTYVPIVFTGAVGDILAELFD